MPCKGIYLNIDSLKFISERLVLILNEIYSQMKLPNLYLFFQTLLCLLFLSCGLNNSKNCTKKVIDERDVHVYYTAAEKRSEPEIEQPKPLKHIKKMLSEKHYVYLTEEHEGIHVIDNIDPANPKCISFIKIAGNWDMTIKGNILYADSYADLLIFDVSNPAKPRLIRRLDDVFDWDNVIGRYLNAGLEKEMVQEVNHIKKEYHIACNDEIDFENKNTAEVAKNGSMSRFCRQGNYLYSIDDLDLYVFNISYADNPVKVNKLRVEDKIETVFAHKKRLFIGGLQGVYMYDITSPDKPKQLDIFRHVESCDPIIIDEAFAYISTRAESACRRGKNALFVLDVSNFDKCSQIAEFPMQHPYGLAINDNRLYVAEAEFGVKMFSTTEKDRIADSLLASDKSLHAFDLIALKDKKQLLMTGNDGFYVYDISKADKLIRIGGIKAFGN